MIVIVADTGPINYLLLIQQIELLPHFFDRVLLPQQVHEELLGHGAPAVVNTWALNLPEWCEVQTAAISNRPELDELDLGETAAIELALAHGNAGILVDDFDGRAAAERLGLEVTGTLGILKRASAAGLVDLESALNDLLKTNFRVSRSTLEQIRRHS
jgi:predicted nucleic acid-binding protein